MAGKINWLFETPKRAIFSIASFAAVLILLGVGIGFAAGSLTKGPSIGEEEAKRLVFADAEVDRSAAERIRTEYKLEKGQYVYEIEFTAGDMEYEYSLRASDGTVIKKESKEVPAGGTEETDPVKKITPEAARDIALTDAGLAAAEVSFTKTKLELENGESVYEIEFHTSAHRYDYEISAETGAVYAKETEPLKNGITAPSGSSSDGKTLIGEEEAKSIAAGHVGFQTSDVTFSKVTLERENGYMVYEIEFRKNGAEYEYEINAETGAIIKYDQDLDG